MISSMLIDLVWFGKKKLRTVTNFLKHLISPLFLLSFSLIFASLWYIHISVRALDIVHGDVCGAVVVVVFLPLGEDECLLQRGLVVRRLFAVVELVGGQTHLVHVVVHLREGGQAQ